MPYFCNKKDIAKIPMDLNSRGLEERLEKKLVKALSN